jgi:hypothetical protein
MLVLPLWQHGRRPERPSRAAAAKPPKPRLAMFVHYGLYHFRPKAVAFRNDYCRTCDRPRLAVRVRTFDVFHLYWVPLLPVGFWRRWYCSTCKGDPHARTRTRRGFKIAAGVILVLFTLFAWTLLPEVEPDWRWVWGTRGVVSGLLLVTVVSLARHRPEADLAALLAIVAPFAGHQCPLCGGDLLVTHETRCARCGARSEPLARPG